jgi:hypothetical protein
VTETHFLISGSRKDAAQRAVQRPYREIFHFAPFGCTRLGHHRRQ